ncbi:MAG: hypothetical protein Q8O03_05875, partial [Nanoarchaeota archaeon]|nr:hypothetical protein [Nanoarchaeota archaeon]
MNLTIKRGKSIFLITLMILTLAILFSSYILKSGSEKFVILDVNKVSGINDPALKAIVKAAEECNKIKVNTTFKSFCYLVVAEESGYYYGNTICEKFNKIFHTACYGGYGKRVGEKYSPDLTAIQNECSKITPSSSNYSNACLSTAARFIGEESASHIETEQCKKLEQNDAKQRCYEGIGRHLAEDNRQLDLCKKTEYEEACLLGFAYITNNKVGKEEALQVCNSLSDPNSKKCYYRIGVSHTWAYNETINEAFQECEQYPYPEDCKRGAVVSIPVKFFEENQQKNEETASVTTPVMFAIYKPIKLTITKVSLTVKQQIIPHFINYKLVYLKIILSSLGLILIVRVSKNRKVQELIKKLYEGIRIVIQKTYYTSTRIIQKTYYTSTKELLIIYKESKLLIRDILNIDKTTATSFFKELKAELGSKEGKKKLLVISLVSITAILALAGNIHFENNISGKSFVAATAGELCYGCDTYATKGCTTVAYCDANEVCCSAGACRVDRAPDATWSCYADYDLNQYSCTYAYKCYTTYAGGTACDSTLYTDKTVYSWLTGPATDKCCGDDAGEDFAGETDGTNFCCNAASTADDSYCDATWGWNIDGVQCQNDVEDTDGIWTPPTADNDIRCQCGSGSGNPCTTDYANTGVDGICATGATNDCYASDVALVTATYYSCDGDGDGYRCDTNTATGAFSQDSMCLSTSNNGGAWDCTTTGHACNDGTYYENSCASCAQANGCESSITSGGDFSATGICITGGACDETTHACYDDTNYQAACSSCALTSTTDSGGDSCDTITDGSYASGGICTDTGTCTAVGGTVRIDASASNTFIVNCDSSGDTCDTATASNLNNPFVADGICASNLCDSNEVCLDSGIYYSGCGVTCSYTDQCDSDGGTTFGANGVCGVLGSTCCTDFGSDADNSNAPSTCNIEATVCGAGTNGYYCDDVDDGSWSASTTPDNNKYRCDASDTTCISCATNMTELLTAVNTELNGDGKCESGCEAHTTCDEQESGAAINSTTYCSSFCGLDEIPDITSPMVVSIGAPLETSPSYHNESLNISYVINDTNADNLISWITCFGDNATEATPNFNASFGGFACTNSSVTDWNVVTCEAKPSDLSGIGFNTDMIATGNFTCKFYVDDGNITVSSNEDTIMTDAAPVWFFEGLNVTDPNLNEDTQIDVDSNLDVGLTGNCTDIDSNESAVMFQLGHTSGGTWWINGSTTVPSAGANLSYLPTANQSGSSYGLALISCYTPGGLEASNISINVTVDAVNDNPWWDAIGNTTYSFTEDLEEPLSPVLNSSFYFRDEPLFENDQTPKNITISTNTSNANCYMNTGTGAANNFTIFCQGFNNLTDNFIITLNGTDSDTPELSETMSFEAKLNAVNDQPWWDPDLVVNQTTTEDSGASITYNLDEFSWDVESDINLINMTYGIDAIFGDNNATGTNCSINGAELYCLNEQQNRTGDNILNITALDSDGAMTSIFMNISTLPVNDQPWWNETVNNTYSYLEDLPPTGLSYIIWDEAGLNNTYWDVENEGGNHLPYNCTVAANDTNIVTNVSYDDGSDGNVRADSVANMSGTFILTTNCSDIGWLSDVTSFEITIDPVNDPPTAPTITLNFTYDNTNYTNESMWCEVYIEDIDNTTGLSVDLIVMNSTDPNINTAVEQYFLPDAYISQNNATYVSFEINETNFTKGDYVWCQAKINDQNDNSSWTNSTSLKVENYPVQISDPLGNFTISEDFTNFTIYWGNNWTDADYNAYETNEVINWTFFMNDTEILGITMDNDTDTVYIGSLPNATGVVEVNWTVIDSDGAEYNETVYWNVSQVNDAPFPVLLDSPANETNHSVMPVFSWSNTTDIDNESIEYILQVDDDPTFPTTPTLKYSNVSILETANPTQDVSV